MRARFMTLLVAAASASALAQTATEPIRGDVERRDGNVLHVHAASGASIAFRLSDSVRVSIRAPATLDAIKAGNFVATTATPRRDGTLVASEVRIFSESMRGLGEGHRPMASRPGSTMTNATVASVGGAAPKRGDTMTNATVAGVAGQGQGRTMQLVYKGGEQTVFVAPDTPVATIEDGDAASLAPGEHVIVYASGVASGAPVAERISVGKNGSVPPN